MLGTKQTTHQMLLSNIHVFVSLTTVNAAESFLYVLMQFKLLQANLLL